MVAGTEDTQENKEALQALLRKPKVWTMVFFNLL